MKQLLLRVGVAWLGMLVLAFANGALREFVFKSFISSNKLAHQISCITGIALWTTFVYLIWNKLHIVSMKEACLVGVLWFVATMLFETFVLNRNLSAHQIFETYNLAKGELWGLVLLWIGLLPIVLFKFFGKFD